VGRSGGRGRSLSSARIAPCLPALRCLSDIQSLAALPVREPLWARHVKQTSIELAHPLEHPATQAPSATPPELAADPSSLFAAPELRHAAPQAAAADPPNAQTHVTRPLDPGPRCATLRLLHLSSAPFSPSAVAAAATCRVAPSQSPRRPTCATSCNPSRGYPSVRTALRFAQSLSPHIWTVPRLVIRVAPIAPPGPRHPRHSSHPTSTAPCSAIPVTTAATIGPRPVAPPAPPSPLHPTRAPPAIRKDPAAPTGPRHAAAATSAAPPQPRADNAARAPPLPVPQTRPRTRRRLDAPP
jgi:hypothetical protein